MFQNSPCDVCSMSRQHILPFPLNHSQSSNIFYLIHVDLWGPYIKLPYRGLFMLSLLLMILARPHGLFCLKINSMFFMSYRLLLK